VRALIRPLTFVVLFLCSTLAIAQTPLTPMQEEGRNACAEIQKNLNELAVFTQTSCRAGGGATPDSLTFLVISISTIWNNADAKQAWLEYVTEAAGATLNAHPAVKVDEIIVADPSQLEARVAYSLPAALVKELQANVKSGKLKRDDMYPLIEKGLVSKPINAR
jgi:hypothetical protein